MSFTLNFNIDLDAERKLIRSKIYGIWKKETAEEYHTHFAAVVKPLLRKKWAKLINLGNWKSSYPEMINVIGDHIKWCHEHNAVYSVYVVDNPVTKKQLQRMIAHSGYEEACPVFDSQSEAESFLREHGF